ncbi:MAG TPA: LLM class flavin-dependent oxidoreductase [Acidimicrobiia bacterium]|jgi:alkanesulfonate monooxygenase SsuD/methylene tetrahydromethanopterin reductase-like flavin-dependent oxidoreductase (luciferase family)
MSHKVMLTMRQDFRAPGFGPTSTSEIYSAALEMWRWSEAHGFDMNVVSEHHGVDDGWIPAPLTVAAIGLARTERIPFFVSACLLPLHDPVRIAEQIAVIDCAAPGRLITVFGAGYRVEEFEMAGVPHKERTKVLEEYVSVVVRALTEERFEWRGRTISVTPRPISQPHPTIMVGGGVPAAARRAARLRLPMMPMNADPELPQAYNEEAEKIGYTGGFVTHPNGPTFVHVTDDPERAWAEIGAYLLYETQTYASYQTPGQHSMPVVHADDLDGLRAATSTLWVDTPDGILARLADGPTIHALNFHPLAGGLPPDLAWASLELFAAKVLPTIGA